MTATIAPLTAIDPAMTEQVLDRAFGADRHARTAYRIRAGADWLPALSFAALDDEELLVGTIQCWPIALRTEDGTRVPLVMVGPVAVLPERQGEGFGRGLMAAMLEADARLGPGESASDRAQEQGRASEVGSSPLPQVLIGDQGYYGRWGFGALHTRGWRCPGPYDPERLLARGTALATLPRTGMLCPWEV